MDSISYVSIQCPALSCRHVLFGFSSSELCVVPRVFVYLLNLAKYFLWRARNDHHFCDVRPGAIPLMEVINARPKCHLCLFFKCFQSPRVGSIVTTCSRFWSWSWCLPSFVATLLRTSFLYLVISSLDLRKSYTLIIFGGSPVPFWALPIWA